MQTASRSLCGSACLASVRATLAARAKGPYNGLAAAHITRLPSHPSLSTRQFTNGTVHVKATYDKSYELILMPLQAAVLLPFNDGEGGRGPAGGAVRRAGCATCSTPRIGRPTLMRPHSTAQAAPTDRSANYTPTTELSHAGAANVALQLRSCRTASCGS